jgi:hypothetical protein
MFRPKQATAVCRCKADANKDACSMPRETPSRILACPGCSKGYYCRLAPPKRLSLGVSRLVSWRAYAVQCLVRSNACPTEGRLAAARGWWKQVGQKRGHDPHDPVAWDDFLRSTSSAIHSSIGTTTV